MEAGILGKTAICLVGGSGVVVAGCYAGGIIKFGEERETSGVIPTQTISWESLTKDGDFSSTYSTTGKIGKDYGQYLVSAKYGNNEKWWKESYKQYEQDIKDSNVKPNLSADFRTSVGIALAYSESNDKALNKVCESIYKKETNLISFESGSGDKHNLGKDLLKYCSPLRQIPTLIPQSNTYDSGKIGNTGHSNKLVSTKDTENTKGFWEAQQKWFKDLGNNVTDQYFGQFFEEKDGSKALKDNENIKDICDGAYKLTATEESGTETKTSPKLNDVKKYCTFAKLITSSSGS